MFGLEKKGKGKGLFEFDLEQDLKKDPKKAKKLLEEVATKIQELKTMLRSGTEGEEMDQAGLLLHGYTALQKVLKNLGK